MCKCTPEIRTPFCGKPGCVWPKLEEKSKYYLAIKVNEAGYRLQPVTGLNMLYEQWKDAKQAYGEDNVLMMKNIAVRINVEEVKE